jgi:hypothetical protein
MLKFKNKNFYKLILIKLDAIKEIGKKNLNTITIKKKILY